MTAHHSNLTQKDSLINKLEEAVKKALNINDLVGFIPEVGMNIVYSRPKPFSKDDVAGLSGRIIKAMGKPVACGEIFYGASQYLSSVVIEAMKLNSSKCAALNIRGGDDVRKKLEAIGLRVHVLPSKVNGEGCPAAVHLRNSNRLADAYLHPGDFGIEPSTTIIGENPLQLIELLEKLVKLE